MRRQALPAQRVRSEKMKPDVSAGAAAAGTPRAAAKHVATPRGSVARVAAEPAIDAAGADATARLSLEPVSAGADAAAAAARPFVAGPAVTPVAPTAAESGGEPMPAASAAGRPPRSISPWRICRWRGQRGTYAMRGAATTAEQEPAPGRRPSAGRGGVYVAPPTFRGGRGGRRGRTVRTVESPPARRGLVLVSAPPKGRKRRGRRRNRGRRGSNSSGSASSGSASSSSESVAARAHARRRKRKRGASAPAPPPRPGSQPGRGGIRARG